MSDYNLEKEYFRITEKYLYHYKDIESYISNIEEDIKNIKAGNILSIRSIRYDDVKTSQTFNIGREVENKVVNIVSYVQDLEIEIYKEKRLKSKLEKAISNLNPIRQKIIKLRYFENMGWTEMALELYHDEKTLRKYKNEAVKSIAIALYGSKVFQEDNPTLFDMLAI